MFAVKIAGAGASVPTTGTRNGELESRLGLAPGWIERRTGILFRPVAGQGQAVSSLAIEAGARALGAARIDASEIGLVLLATSTPDHLLPPTSPLVAHSLGASHAGAVDLTGACSGFLYGLVMGSAMGQALGRPVLVIGANILSRRVDPLDASTAALFADGAGAVVLAPALEAHVLGFYLGADGAQYESIMIPAGGSREPLSAAGLEAKRNTMRMKQGAGVFRSAVRLMAEAGSNALGASHLAACDIDWWIPHQANLRLIRETQRLLGIDDACTIITLDRFANSSAATIPIALAESIDAGRMQSGQMALLTSVGAGMTSAGVVVRL